MPGRAHRTSSSQLASQPIAAPRAHDPSQGLGNAAMAARLQAPSDGGGIARAESSFGIDMSDVELFSGDGVAESYGAAGVALGTDLHFADAAIEGGAVPSELLAHELVHAAQFIAGGESTGKSSLEGEADRSVAAVEAGSAVSIEGSAGGQPLLETWTQWFGAAMDATLPPQESAPPPDLDLSQQSTGLVGGNTIGTQSTAPVPGQPDQLQQVTAGVDSDGNPGVTVKVVTTDGLVFVKAELAKQEKAAASEAAAADGEVTAADQRAAAARAQQDEIAAEELGKISPTGDEAADVAAARAAAAKREDFAALDTEAAEAELAASSAKSRGALASTLVPKLQEAQASLTADNALDVAAQNQIEVPPQQLVSETRQEVDVTMSDGTAVAGSSQKNADGSSSKSSVGLTQSGNGTAVVGATDSQTDASGASQSETNGVAVVTTANGTGVGASSSSSSSDNNGGTAQEVHGGVLVDGAAGAAGGASKEGTKKIGTDGGNKTQVGLTAKSKVSGDGSFEVTVRPVAGKPGRYEVVMIIRVAGAGSASVAVGRDGSPNAVTGSVGVSGGASAAGSLEMGQELDEAQTLAFLADCDAVEGKKPTSGQFPSIEQLVICLTNANPGAALSNDVHLEEGQSVAIDGEVGGNVGANGKIASPAGGASIEVGASTKSTARITRRMTTGADGRPVEEVSVTFGTTDTTSAKGGANATVGVVNAGADVSHGTSEASSTGVSLKLDPAASDYDAILDMLSACTCQADLDAVMADPAVQAHLASVTHRTATSETNGGGASMGVAGSDTLRVDAKGQVVESHSETVTETPEGQSARVDGAQDTTGSVAVGGVVVVDETEHAGVSGDVTPDGTTLVIDESASGRELGDETQTDPATLPDSLARKGLAATTSDVLTDAWSEVRVHITLSDADLRVLCSRAADPNWIRYSGGIATWKSLGAALAHPAPAGVLDDPAQDLDLTRLRAVAALFESEGGDAVAVLTNVLDNWESEDAPNVGTREEWPRSISAQQAEWAALGKEVPAVAPSMAADAVSAVAARIGALIAAIDGCTEFRDPVAKSTMIETANGWKQRVAAVLAEIGGECGDGVDIPVQATDDRARLQQLLGTFQSNKSEESTQIARIRAEADAMLPAGPFSTRFEDAVAAVSRTEELYERWIAGILEYRALQSAAPELPQVSASSEDMPNFALEPEVIAYCDAARDLESSRGEQRSADLNYQRRIARFGAY